jgi:hypothetical protein
MSSTAVSATRAAARGVVGSLAMSGLRRFAADLELLEKTPPEAIAERPARGLMRRVPPRRRSAAVHVIHTLVGAAGGLGFGLVPDGVRRRVWAGPAWGVAIWLSYETVAAPVLGLRHSGRERVTEHLLFLLDHLVYGYVLSETHGEPRR